MLRIFIVLKWPDQHAAGGGAVIPCRFRITVKGNLQLVLKRVNDAVNAMPEKTVLDVNVN